MQSNQRKHTLKQILLGIATGVGYGLISRVIFGKHEYDTLMGVMLISFISLVPIGLGVVVVAMAPPERRTWPYAVFMPWLTSFLTVVAATVTHLEGMICVVFICPTMLTFSSIGGVFARLILGHNNRHKLHVIAGFTLLPYVVAPIESMWELPVEMRHVDNEIFIRAPKEVVWQNIKEVREIQPEERHFAWAYAIGFPQPLAATLSHEGVGGVRRASFAGNVLFLETIDQWEEGKLLSFTIRVQDIPPTTLDEHVKIGGKYFDVLRGTYELEPQAEGVLVKLSSSHRLSTHFNRYAAFWTDWVMDDIQSTILKVIKARCESV